MPPALIITPRSALFDQPIQIRATGLTPAQDVRIESSVRFPWAPGTLWKAALEAQAGEAGELQLVSPAPTEPPDPAPDPMRLFWSLRPDPSPLADQAGELDTRQPLIMNFTLASGGQVLASATIERSFQIPDIHSHSYTADSLRGRFFYSAGGQPQPGILFLSGSGSLAPILPISALLASYGYAVLALAYYGGPGLPAAPREIPIERFSGAIDWLSRQPAVLKERIAVMGGSLGGELALLVGSMDARVKAVAAVSPSPVIFCEPAARLNARSPWTYQGQPLPFAAASLPRLAAEVLAQALRGRAFQYSPVYRAALKNPRAYQEAIVPLESIHGPILLVSGTADGYWPATDLCEIALRRLQENSFVHPVYHLGYQDAGHAFYAPYLLPTTTIETPVLPGIRFSSGGTPEINSQAQADSWSKILRFFQTHL